LTKKPMCQATYHREEFNGMMYGCNTSPVEGFHQTNPRTVHLLVGWSSAVEPWKPLSVRQDWRRRCI